jgi:hypothetical protein
VFAEIIMMNDLRRIDHRIMVGNRDGVAPVGDEAGDNDCSAFPTGTNEIAHGDEL